MYNKTNHVYLIPGKYSQVITYNTQAIKTHNKIHRWLLDIELSNKKKHSFNLINQ